MLTVRCCALFAMIACDQTINNIDRTDHQPTPDRLGPDQQTDRQLLQTRGAGHKSNAARSKCGPQLASQRPRAAKTMGKSSAGQQRCARLHGHSSGSTVRCRTIIAPRRDAIIVPRHRGGRRSFTTRWATHPLGMAQRFSSPPKTLSGPPERPRESERTRNASGNGLGGVSPYAG